MADVNMRIILSAVDGASSVFRSLTSSLTGTGVGQALGVVGAIAEVGLAATKMAVDVGVTAATAAGNFQQQMTKLYTTAGESKTNLQMVGDGILAMTTQVGIGATDLGNAMYWIESGGLHGKAGLDALRIAAEAAKAENADLDKVSIALAASLNAYAGSGMTDVQVMNTLTAATGQGMMTFEQLSGSLASVLPAAAKFGVSLNNVTAALATMTAQGDPAAQAATHLKQVILALEAPSKIGAAALASVGLTSAEVATEMRTSLPGALQMITDAVGKKFPQGSAAYNQAIKNIAGGSKQMMGFLELTGAHMVTFTGNVNKISSAVKAGGNDLMGWSDIQQNFNFKLDQFQALVGSLLIKLGEQLLPVLSQLFTAVTPIVQAFADWITQSGALQNSLSFLTGGISDMATMISGSFSQMQQNAAYSMLKIKDDSISKSLETANGVLSNMEYQKHFLEMELSQTTDTNQRAYLKMQLDATDASLKQAQGVVNNYTTQRKGIETQMSMATDSVALQTLKQKDIALTASLDQANGVVANYDQQRKDILQELQRTTDPVMRAYLEAELDAIDKSHRQAVAVAANYKKQHDDVVKQMDDMKTKVNADNNNILTNMLSTFKKIGDAFAPVVGPFQQLIGLIKQFTQDMLQGVFASDGFHEAMGLLLAALPPLLYVLGQVVLWLGKVIKFVFDNQTAFFLLGVAALGLAAIITVVLVAAFAALVVELALTVLWLTILFGPIIALVALIMNWGAVMAWLGGVWNSVITGMENAWNGMVAWAYTAGQMLVNSLIAGIVSRIPGIGGIMQQITAIIDSYLPHSPAKQGPLSRLNEYGPALVRGITAGVDRSLPLLQASMQLMVTPIHRAALGQTGGTPGLPGPVGIAAPSGSSGSGGAINVYLTISNINDFGPSMPDSVARQLAQKVSQQLAHNMRTQSGRIVIGNG